MKGYGVWDMVFGIPFGAIDPAKAGDAAVVRRLGPVETGRISRILAGAAGTPCVECGSVGAIEGPERTAQGSRIQAVPVLRLRHRTNVHLNNWLEQNHCGIKGRI